VDLGGPVLALAAGDVHTCALLNGGRVRCWGSNGQGMLGLGHTDEVGEDAVQRTMTELNFAREAVRTIAVHRRNPEQMFVTSFNNALYRVAVYLQSRAGEYLQFLQG
jgi:alpha-tubulin suppressor-like RCC1 family protein